MHARPRLLELQLRNGSICRACSSCLSAANTQAVTPQWTARYSTESSIARRSRRGITRRGTRAASRAPAEEIDPRQAAAASDPVLQRILSGADSKNTSGGLDINYYEKDEDDNTRQLNEGGYDRSFGSLDDGEFKGLVQGMRKTARSDDEKSAFDEVMNAMGPNWSDIQGPEDLERLSSRLKEYTASIDRKIAATLGELPQDAQDDIKDITKQLGIKKVTEEQAKRQIPTAPVIPEAVWTMNQRRKVSRLNAVMRQVFGELQRGAEITNGHVTAIYKGYHLSKLTLARSWDSVPIEVWDFLWRVLSADESVNPHRLSRLAALSRDMSEAKVDLSPSQQLLTIEATFMDGWEDKALDSWKRCTASLGQNKSEAFKDFWELGVRMYCRLGELEKAQRAITTLLENHSDARIMLPMIRTLSEKGGVENTQLAWDMYRDMRKRLGQTMKLGDYDKVISYFLATDQVENALYAFVDMMSDGEIDLKKQHFLPSSVANKFFLGKWLKRLIGAGDLEGAFSVVKFMREKGVGASPIQLNGLIGAWQRSGLPENLEKADKLAWEMIESRLGFVEHRGKSSIRAQAQDAWKTVNPRATLETFCLMADHYRLRGLSEKLAVLWEAFQKAHISPDAFMMNQILESYVSANQIPEAHDLYETLVSQGGVAPDPYTFSALWKTPSVNNYHRLDETARLADVSTCRQLFAEMVHHRHVFEGKIDGQLARKILHTFRRLKDVPSTVVALSALKDIFGFLPPDTLALEMAIGTTKLNWESSTNRRKLVSAKREMDHFISQSAESTSEAVEGDRRGEVLQEFVHMKMVETMGDVYDIESLVREASEEMAVHGYYDTLAAEVEEE